MSRAKPIRLSDGRVYRSGRPRPPEWREPLERAVRGSMVAGVPVDVTGRRSFRLGWKPNCEAPYEHVAFGSKSEHIRGKRNPIFVHIFGRCRKCDACRKARSQMWQIRAMHEYKRWPVTLFGTITMSMDEHYALDARILAGTRRPDGSWKRHPVNIAELSPHELFTARVQGFGDEVQKFLKRLRKGDAYHRPDLRYLIVAEAHDSERTSAALRGRPHFHMLLHEVVQGSLVHGYPTAAIQNGESGEYLRSKYRAGNTWREGVFVKDNAFLRTQWTFGFTKFQFAENERAASYLCKYLNKASDARIRASVGYGLDEIEDQNNDVRNQASDVASVAKN